MNTEKQTNPEHERERRELWRDVYVSFVSGRDGTLGTNEMERLACLRADVALRAFDGRFRRTKDGAS